LQPGTTDASAAREQPANHQPESAGAQPWCQRVEADETRTRWTNLEDANRRHPDGATAASALATDRVVHGWRRLIRPIRPRVTGSLAAACTEGVGDLGDGHDGRVTVSHWLPVDMAYGEVALEEFADWPEWNRV
jgi:hypothetical protein